MTVSWAVRAPFIWQTLQPRNVLKTCDLLNGDVTRPVSRQSTTPPIVSGNISRSETTRFHLGNVMKLIKSLTFWDKNAEIFLQTFNNFTRGSNLSSIWGGLFIISFCLTHHRIHFFPHDFTLQNGRPHHYRHRFKTWSSSSPTNQQDALCQCCSSVCSQPGLVFPNCSVAPRGRWSAIDGAFGRKTPWLTNTSNVYYELLEHWIEKHVVLPTEQCKQLRPEADAVQRTSEKAFQWGQQILCLLNPINHQTLWIKTSS